jgi:hypothetical protein
MRWYDVRLGSALGARSGGRSGRSAGSTFTRTLTFTFTLGLTLATCSATGSTAAELLAQSVAGGLGFCVLLIVSWIICCTHGLCGVYIAILAHLTGVLDTAGKVPLDLLVVTQAGDVVGVARALSISHPSVIIQRREGGASSARIAMQRHSRRARRQERGLTGFCCC